MYVLELGGEDDEFAVCEAESAATGVELVAPGLARATAVTERVQDLAYTHRASELVGETDADIDSACALLSAAPIDREGTVAVRARAVRETRISTQEVERELGGVLVERGFSVDLDDPDHELRAVFSDDVCQLGWLEIESRRDFGTRMPTDKPFFQPGSMHPLLARALANIAGAREGTTILDPMCGTGGVLIEAALVGARPLGVDAQEKMVRGARKNLAHYAPDSDAGAVRGDATHLPFPDNSIDGVVFDAPYGRQSKIANLELDNLVAGALSEAHRVASRAVIVGDRPWIDEAREADWTVENEFERRVHRSLTRYIAVLSR
ncbi:methyltransferase domain-containing protein [Haladaptatus pallidirubidus]|uniref:tRNA (guanine(10)-N(2))-dimethyltransferase n=1 Tax=Haladaptatus pallidirubidus TaxID=1008152 RepID=A0AAV3UFG8_9EURY|nr:methyltransferase domain-containing protein [Haladaptatus pallidirubidus]